MLFTFALYISVSKIVLNYENSINNDYSIILVSSSPLIYSDVENIKDIDVKKIIYLNKDKILKNLGDDVSTETYELLQKRLPYFYTIHLNKFPTTAKLQTTKAKLKKISGIKRVETFSKNHDNMYSLLLLIQTIVSAFFISITIFTFLIILYNVKIWFYEYSNRLSIIMLHGGSIYYGAKPIIRIAFISSILSSVIVILIVYLFKNNIPLIVNKEIISVVIDNLTPYTKLEISLVFLLSIFISYITVFGVLIKHRLK
jgi:cell division transport system permease protein